MVRTECPHCGAKLPSNTDAFCGECRNDLDAPPLISSPRSRAHPRFPIVAPLLGFALGGTTSLIGLVESGLGKAGMGGMTAAGFVFGSAIVGLLIGTVVGALIYSVKATANDPSPDKP